MEQGSKWLPAGSERAGNMKWHCIFCDSDRSSRVHHFNAPDSCLLAWNKVPDRYYCSVCMKELHVGPLWTEIITYKEARFGHLIVHQVIHVPVPEGCLPVGKEEV